MSGNTASSHPSTALDATTPARDRPYQRLIGEVGIGGVPAGPGDQSTVAEAELAQLPEVVQRYLRFMGVVGRPRIWSLRARFVGRFRLRPRLGWMPAEAWQYNSSLGIARIFVMRLRFAECSSTSAGHRTTSAPPTGTPTSPAAWPVLRCASGVEGGARSHPPRRARLRMRQPMARRSLSAASRAGEV